MTRRRVHGKHLELSHDLVYRCSSTASTDLGYGGSSTKPTSTHTTSHLVDHYQKMSMQKFRSTQSQAVKSLGTCHNGCTLYGCFRLLRLGQDSTTSCMHLVCCN